jgi:hypothetical protein
VAHEQALGDQAVERVELGAGDRLGRGDGGAAGEHRERREARLLAVAEQFVAPVDRCSKRLLARGRVARTDGQPGERHIQALGELRGESRPQRAAASSIASGSPSRRRQISATTAALPSPRSKSGS